jgi:hypothetical protein
LHELCYIQISIETEIKKLKLELKKASEQYGIVCKEAVLAKLKVTSSCYEVFT